MGILEGEGSCTKSRRVPEQGDVTPEGYPHSKTLAASHDESGLGVKVSTTCTARDHGKHKTRQSIGPEFGLVCCKAKLWDGRGGRSRPEENCETKGKGKRRGRSGRYLVEMQW